MAESSIAVAVRIRPFSAKEAIQLAPRDNFQPFLGDGGLSTASPSRMGMASGSNAPSLRTKFLRPIITPVDDKVLIFDPPDNNPLSRLYSSGQNSFEHGNKKAKDVRYAFDRVFDDKCGQEMVFENTTKPLLDGILNGYNASVFAYGATGCGKTHTISGTPEDPGVIFLTMKELYERIETSREDSEVQVRLSYLEVYNESIRDLLSPVPTPPGQGLMLREDAARKMSVVGITEHIPESPQMVLEMIQEGNLRRTMSPTEANAVSSRSHAVLQINVTQRPRTADTITETTSASLNIIDLAGSERAAATRNNGVRMKEGANINKSLLALGNCINALCHSGGQASKHVPYRNSKLTRLLKFSLGGNCKTVMIVCVSPSSAHYDETHNTLKYANQAKNIRTKVSRNMLNVDRHVAQYVQAIHELREEVSELKAKLADRAAIESAAEKRKKVDIVKEMQQAKAKMRESTDHVKRVVQEKAGVEAHLAAAGARLASLRQRLTHLQEEIQSQPSSSKDLEYEKETLLRMTAREEAILQDEKLLSTLRNLNNSLQIQRGIIVAVSQNTKFDVDATESIRTFGDCLLAEIEMLRSNVKYESLKCAFDMGTAFIPDLINLGIRSTFAMKEAGFVIESHTEGQGEGSTSLSLLAKQMQILCKGNDEVFTRMAGTSTIAIQRGDSNALRRGGKRDVVAVASAATATAAPSLIKQRRGSSVAGTSNKALLPLTSPRKALMRRSTAGPRRSGVHASRSASGHNRRFSSNSPAAIVPKKSFRWADETGEGRIDDHDRRSASPPQVRISLPMKKVDVVEVQTAKWKDRVNLLKSEREAEVGQSSGADWEDVGKEASAGVVKREGRLFERNFLAKKDVKQSRLAGGGEKDKVVEEEHDSDQKGDLSFSDPIRATLSEMSNGISESSSEDYSGPGLAEYAPMSVRSSPYTRRSDSLGPIRRKTRSSIGDNSIQAAKAASTSCASNPPRLATGPPLFTASRSGRSSTISSPIVETNRKSVAIKSGPATPKGSLILNNSYTTATPPTTAWR